MVFCTIIKMKKGFTFVENLITLGTLMFLIVSLLVFIKPITLFQQVRDNVRKADLLNFVVILNTSYRELQTKLFV